MQTSATSHKDNMLGICHALGEDFGFNPIYMRIALAAMLLVSPIAMLATYGAAGIVVLASHLLVRPKRAGKAAGDRRPAPPLMVVATDPHTDAYETLAVREPLAA